MRMPIEPWILRRYFRKLQQDVNFFEHEVAKYLKDGDVVLDAGCGSGEFGVLRKCGKPASKIVGMDVSAEALEKNSYIDEKIVGDLEHIPYPDETFDMIVCEGVFEHMKRPRKVIDEFARILKKDGNLIVRTPNIWYLRNALSAFLPIGARKWLKRKLLHYSNEGTFPTYYRCNSPRRLKGLCEDASLREKSIRTFRHCPGYWGNRTMVSLFTLYEKLTDHKWLSFTKVYIVGVFSKR